MLSISSQYRLGLYHRFIGFLLVPLLYYAGAAFANEFTIFTRGAVIIWPSNSVVLAALLLLGGRDFLPLALGAMLAEVFADMPFIGWQKALLFGAGNIIEVTIAFALLRRWRFGHRFDSIEDLLKFIGATVVIAALVGAAIGGALHCYFHNTDTSYLEHVRVLWFGDALGLMIFTPLFLSLWPFENQKKTSPRVTIYSYDLVTATTALLVLCVFIASRDGQFLSVHIGPTLLLPYVVYLGARFGVRWASIATAVVTFITIIMMDKGLNPFGDLTIRRALIQSQEFIFIMSIVSLGAATLFSKLRLQQNELEQANLSLHELNQALENRVLERTAALTQANLQLEKEMQERKQAEQELQVANRELHRLAEIDGLTQIANRRTFDTCLKNEWKRAAREGCSLSLILFDIDFFKRFNDHYGHPAGDICLLQIATVTANAIKRPSDLVARYGGEEFAILLPETGTAGATHVVEQIRAAIQQCAIVHEYSDVCGTVTVSAGVATVVPGNEQSLESLVELADRALYQAKAQGRNRYVLEASCPNSLNTSFFDTSAPGTIALGNALSDNPGVAAISNKPL